jgi:hypothetical protein
LSVQAVVDYLGRSQGTNFPSPLTSAPVFVFLPAGQAASLPLETPPRPAPARAGSASSVVLQLLLPHSAVKKVEDLPWSEGYAYQAKPGQSLDFKLHAYNFATNGAAGRLEILRHPQDWNPMLGKADFKLAAMERAELAGSLRLPNDVATRDGWVVLRADCGEHGRPVLAFRIVVHE